MLLAWDSNVQIRLLVEESFFRGPLAPIMRWSGAVALDRENPGATIRELLADAGDRRGVPARHRRRGHPEQGRVLEVGLPPHLPADRDPDSPGLPRRALAHGRLGAHVTPSDDLHADMDRIRAFYADKTGIRPDRATVPRLREEPPLTSRVGCRRRESNPHALGHTDLNRACLPVPPLRREERGAREAKTIAMPPGSRPVTSRSSSEPSPLTTATSPASATAVRERRRRWRPAHGDGSSDVEAVDDELEGAGGQVVAQPHAAGRTS